MKKTIFKTIYALILLICFSSCQTDDGILDISEEESDNLLTETDILNESNEKVSSNTCTWNVQTYNGTIQVIGGQVIPLVGTYMNTVATCDKPTLGWVVSGSFKIISGGNQKNARILRTSKEKGSVYYYWEKSGGIMGWSRRDYPAVLSPQPSCPTTTHAIMRAGNLESIKPSYVTSVNYNNQYTYKWKVVNQGVTYYKTGKSIILRSDGSNVTLSVSFENCTIQTQTEYFFSDY